jgi:hypothetical protein
MKKYLMFILLIPVCVQGQTYIKSVSGTVNIYPLIEMNINTLMSDQINFSSSLDYNQDKVVNSQYDVSIKSNRPWQVTVRSNNPVFTASGGASENVSVGLIALRKHNTIPFIQLTTTPQMLLSNENNNVVNAYSLDLKVSPPWDYHGGSFTTILLFTASHQ